MSTAKSTRISIDTRPRTSLRLRGVVRKANTPLNHDADLAIAYAQAWMSRHGSAAVPAAGIVWQALNRYMGHLADPALDAADEVNTVRRTCEGAVPDEEARQGAWTRLQAAPEGAPLPPWHAIRSGPHAASEMAAFDARSEALFNELMRERTQRTKAHPSPLTTDEPTNTNP